MVLSIAYGVHTYSAGMVLTHKQYKKIWDACYDTGCIEDTSNPWKKKEKLYCYAFMEQGIKIYLHGKSGKWYRLRIQIEPCRVLGEKDPTALAKLNKDTYKNWLKQLISC